MYSDKTVIQKLLCDTDIAGLDAAVEGIHFFDECEPRILDPEPEERIIKTACRACIANCGVLAHVRNGCVVKLEGNPEDSMSRGKMCAKGLSGIQALYNPNRNKYPLERVGERAGGKWRRITWDAAITGKPYPLKMWLDRSATSLAWWPMPQRLKRQSQIRTTSCTLICIPRLFRLCGHPDSDGRVAGDGYAGGDLQYHCGKAGDDTSVGDLR